MVEYKLFTNISCAKKNIFNYSRLIRNYLLVRMKKINESSRHDPTFHHLVRAYMYLHSAIFFVRFRKDYGFEYLFHHIIW